MPASKSLGRTSASALARKRRDQGHVSRPPARWMREELPRLLELYGAFGFHIGMKRRGGRWLRQPAMVFLTVKKGDARERAAGSAKIPKAISWKDGKRRHSLPTDVHEICVDFELQLKTAFGPGDGATFGGSSALIGAAVRSPEHGSCVLTAGHLFGSTHSNEGADVAVQSGQLLATALAVEVIVDNEVDYALLKLPNDVECDNLFDDQIRIGPVYTPTEADLGADLYILGRSGFARHTICRGVNQRLQFGHRVLSGVIATDAVTKKGQSGGALMDASNRLWGFLLGALPGQFSIFVPAQSIFDMAGVFLVEEQKDHV